MDKMVILALDPGTTTTGYGIFKQVSFDTLELKQYGLIKAMQKKQFQERCVDLQFKIRPIFNTHECTHLLIEYPQFQAGMRGMTSARRGNTLTLAFFCGGVATNWNLYMLGHYKRTKQELPFAYLIYPSEWKGQMPKAVCAKRCHKKFGLVSKYSEQDYNWSDAVMLGDYWIVTDQGMKAKVAKNVIRVDL